MAGLLAFLAFLLRVSYFVTCASALIYSVTFSLFGLRPDARSLLYSAIGIVVFAVPSGRALLRVARGSALIPEARLRERWDAGVVVAFVSLLANFLAALIVIALIDVYRRKGAEADGIAFFAFLDLMLYAIALLCGEIVLVGRNRAIVDAGPDWQEPTCQGQ